MAANISSKEIVQLISIKEDETIIEQKRLRNGDLLIRNAIGESLSLANGVQIIIRPGYFSLSAAAEVTVERSRSGMTSLVFANGDELKFNDAGIQTLRRGLLMFQFTRKEVFELGKEVTKAFNMVQSTAILSV